MSKITAKKLNLTSLKVKKQLDIFLQNHSAPNYQVIVRDVEFRKKLILYILHRIPNQYMPMTPREKVTISPQSIQCSSLEKLQIEKLIYQGFYKLIQEHNKQISSVQQSDFIGQEAV